jgi:hypothetical protein
MSISAAFGIDYKYCSLLDLIIVLLLALVIATLLLLYRCYPLLLYCDRHTGGGGDYVLVPYKCENFLGHQWHITNNDFKICHFCPNCKEGCNCHDHQALQ